MGYIFTPLSGHTDREGKRDIFSANPQLSRFVCTFHPSCGPGFECRLGFKTHSLKVFFTKKDCVKRKTKDQKFPIVSIQCGIDTTKWLDISHSSVVSSAPTILRPRVRSQAHHLHFYHLQYLVL